MLSKDDKKKKNKEKKNKETKRKIVEVPPLYLEDIGTEGIVVKNKKSRHQLSSWNSSSSYIDQRPSISSLPLSGNEDDRRQKRLERFGSNNKEQEYTATTNTEDEYKFKHSKVNNNNNNNNNSPKNKQQFRLVGTCTTLEKSYLRLAEFPKAEQVRPLPILIQALAHIKRRYLEQEDFDWANDQLKSVRQDLTVQHIRHHKLVLDVYETHARLLLEHGDLNEFHQCQTVIRSLTAKSTPMNNLDWMNLDNEETGGKNNHKGGVGVEKLYFLDGINNDESNNNYNECCLEQTEEAADEFLAYGLLYALVQNSWGEMTRILTTANIESKIPSTTSTTSTTSKTTTTKSSSRKRKSKSSNTTATTSTSTTRNITNGPSTSHALKVIESIIHNDYQSFFQLYENAPHMSAYLMDFLVRRVRKEAYGRMIAAYRPSLSVEKFRQALCFTDLEETRQFLKANGAKFIHELGAPPFWVDCKVTFTATGRKLLS